MPIDWLRREIAIRRNPSMADSLREARRLADELLNLLHRKFRWEIGWEEASKGVIVFGERQYRDGRGKDRRGHKLTVTIQAKPIPLCRMEVLSPTEVVLRTLDDRLGDYLRQEAIRDLFIRYHFEVRIS